MDDYRLHTPEQVDISYTVAGLGTRFIALAIDSAIQGVLLFFLFYLWIENIAMNWRWSSDWTFASFFILFALVFYGYFFICELVLRGRTPGKLAAKIRVVRMDGRPVDVQGTLLRNLIRLIDSLPGMYLVGMVAMFVSKDSRRLGDLAAGTVVVVDRKKTTLESIMEPQGVTPVLAGPGGLPPTENTGGLSNQEYSLVRDYLSRCEKFTPEARMEVAAKIAAPLFDKMGAPPHQRVNPEGFLRSLMNPQGPKSER